MKKQNYFKMAAVAGFGISTILFTASSVYAADPSITINNDATNLYTAGANADNTAVYDSETNILKLANFQGDRVVVSNIENLTISLEGENTLSMASYGTAGSDAKAIYAPGVNLTIIGDGKLTVSDSTPDKFKINADDIVVAKNSH